MDQRMDRRTIAMAAAAALTLLSAAAIAQTPSNGGSAGQPRSTQPGQGGTAPGTAARSRPTPSGDRTEANSRSLDTQTFVREAAIGGMAEVELGQLAAGKASSDAVKQFAQRMVTDHSKANGELKTLVQRKGLTLPTELDAKHKQTRDTLAAMSGALFDRSYMDAMRTDQRAGCRVALKAWTRTR
jgi:putative membrane protein